MASLIALVVLAKLIFPRSAEIARLSLVAKMPAESGGLASTLLKEARTATL